MCEQNCDNASKRRATIPSLLHAQHAPASLPYQPDLQLQIYIAQVYAITLYVEADKAARELGVRKRGGFFQDAGTEGYADAIVDGAFSKLLQVQLVRNVDGETFFGVSWQPPPPPLSLPLSTII